MPDPRHQATASPTQPRTRSISSQQKFRKTAGQHGVGPTLLTENRGQCHSSDADPKLQSSTALSLVKGHGRGASKQRVYDGKYDGAGDEQWGEDVYWRPGMGKHSLSAQAQDWLSALDGSMKYSGADTYSQIRHTAGGPKIDTPPRFKPGYVSNPPPEEYWEKSMPWLGKEADRSEGRTRVSAYPELEAHTRIDGVKRNPLSELNEWEGVMDGEMKFKGRDTYSQLQHTLGGAIEQNSEANHAYEMSKEAKELEAVMDDQMKFKGKDTASRLYWTTGGAPPINAEPAVETPAAKPRLRKVKLSPRKPPPPKPEVTFFDENTQLEFRATSTTPAPDGASEDVEPGEWLDKNGGQNPAKALIDPKTHAGQFSDQIGTGHDFDQIMDGKMKYAGWDTQNQIPIGGASKSAQAPKYTMTQADRDYEDIMDGEMLWKGQDTKSQISYTLGGPDAAAEQEEIRQKMAQDWERKRHEAPKPAEWSTAVKDYENVMDGEMKFKGKDTFSQIAYTTGGSGGGEETVRRQMKDLGFTIEHQKAPRDVAALKRANLSNRTPRVMQNFSKRGWHRINMPEPSSPAAKVGINSPHPAKHHLASPRAQHLASNQICRPETSPEPSSSASRSISLPARPQTEQSLSPIHRSMQQMKSWSHVLDGRTNAQPSRVALPSHMHLGGTSSPRRAVGVRSSKPSLATATHLNYTVGGEEHRGMNLPQPFESNPRTVSSLGIERFQPEKKLHRGKGTRSCIGYTAGTTEASDPPERKLHELEPSDKVAARVFDGEMKYKGRDTRSQLTYTLGGGIPEPTDQIHTSQWQQDRDRDAVLDGDMKFKGRDTFSQIAFAVGNPRIVSSVSPFLTATNQNDKDFDGVMDGDMKWQGRDTYSQLNYTLGGAPPPGQAEVQYTVQEAAFKDMDAVLDGDMKHAGEDTQSQIGYTLGGYSHMFNPMYTSQRQRALKKHEAAHAEQAAIQERVRACTAPSPSQSGSKKRFEAPAGVERVLPGYKDTLYAPGLTYFRPGGKQAGGRAVNLSSIPTRQPHPGSCKPMTPAPGEVDMRTMQKAQSQSLLRVVETSNKTIAPPLQQSGTTVTVPSRRYCGGRY